MIFDLIRDKISEIVKVFRIFYSFLKYLKHHRFKIFLLTLFMILTSLFGAITPLLAKYIVDNIIPTQNWTMFYVVLIGYLSVSFILQGINIYQKYISFCINHEVRVNLSSTYFRNILRLPFSEIQQRQSGAQIYRATSDISGVVSLITTFFTAIASNFVSLITAAIIMFNLNWKVTLIYLMFVPFVFLMRVYISMKLRPLQKELREHNESISAFLGQIFSGIKVIKIFGAETSESLKYLRLLRENIRINFRMWTTQIILNKIQWFFESGVGSFLQWWIWFSVMKQYTTLGSAMAISWYFNMIIGPFMALAGTVQGIIASMVPGERVFETLSSPKEHLRTGKRFVGRSRGHSVNFTDVSFSYSNGNEVLKNLSFNLSPGTINALVGPSGSGKTTTINLICGLYSDFQGKIKINDIPLKEASIASLRNLIALVPQEPFVFEDSVLNNIKYSDKRASNDKVINAAQMANIHDKITSLPDGYNTILKKGQKDLSVGERQRITIARAFLRESPILIFDEAFSNLDIEMENRIMNSLREFKGVKTVLIVSHRLKNMIFADNIIVMRDGSILESGTPDELTSKKTLFSKWLESSS